MDFDWASEATEIVDPWVDTELNFTEQTGADWYTLMLSASLGGKPVHGVNAAPSCETLAKVDYAFAKKYTHGMIRVDDKERKVPAMGDDVTEKQYMHKDFKGVTSSTGSFLALDSGVWEPSKRQRGKEAAILAAGIAAHTGDSKAAREIVGKITSDVIDEEAVNSAMVPISHLKREVVSVSKPAHRLFSCGTIQKSIIWEDTQLMNEKLPAVAAVDWGRITTIARYIGEVNSQIDPQFRNIAKSQGIPYAIVKGAWAYVTPGDFMLDPKAFEDVPTISLEKYYVPSLAGAYTDHEMDIVKAAQRAMNEMAYDPAPPSIETLMKITQEARVRAGKRKRDTRVMPQTDVLAAPTSHSIDVNEAARRTAESATAYNALSDVCRNKVAMDSHLLTSAGQVAAEARVGRCDYERVDRITPKLLGYDTWITARNVLAQWLLNADLAHERVARLKRATFQSSLRLETPVTMTGNMLKAARPTTVALCKSSAIPAAPPRLVFEPYANLNVMKGTIAMQETAKFILHHLKEYKIAWAERYEAWARAFSSLTTALGRKQSIKYGAVAKAFRMLNTQTCASIQSRFIEGTKPKETYLYSMALSYCRKRHLDPPTLSRLVFADAKELAIDIDKNLPTTVPFEEVEDFVYTRLEMFAGDLGAGLKPEPEEPDIDKELSEAKPMEVSTGLFSITEDDQAMLDEFEEMMGSVEEGAAKVTMKDVLASYEDADTADSHADANGYYDFAEAYGELGEGARYDPESEYTQNALKTLGTGKDSSKDEDDRVLF